MKRAVDFVVPVQKGEYEYIGFDLEENAARFVFPCHYTETKPTDDTDAARAELIELQKAEAKKILSLIKCVQKEFSFGGSGDESFQFYAMIWLIRDYIDRGYYTETERVVRRGDHGRIDWKHTFRHSAIYFDGSNLLYRDFYVQKNMLDSGNLLAQIYKCCLAYSADCIGFLYNVSQTEPSVFRMDSASDVGFMCYRVQKELSKTFNSYKQMLLRHLLTILKGRQGKIKAVSLCMHDKEFEYVFELLIDSVFGTENVQDFYNKYGYEIDGKRVAASKLRPDTIMKNPNSGDPDYFVLDAKYYNYGYTSDPHDLPQASSIAKQIGYNYYLSNRNWNGQGNKRFYSIFLLPFSQGKDEDCIKFVGYATNCGNQAENVDKVAVCLIDLKTLVDVHFNVGPIFNNVRIGKLEMREKLTKVIAESRCFP